MNDDRELLEKAAKAAGYDGVRPATFGMDCWMALIEGDWEPWNPLTDDGDALRLAVKLRFIVGCPGVVRDEDGRIDFVSEDTEEDDYAATRRAIVRAAASLVKEGDQQ